MKYEDFISYLRINGKKVILNPVQRLLLKRMERKKPLLLLKCQVYKYFNNVMGVTEGIAKREIRDKE